MVFFFHPGGGNHASHDPNWIQVGNSRNLQSQICNGSGPVNLYPQKAMRLYFIHLKDEKIKIQKGHGIYLLPH